MYCLDHRQPPRLDGVKRLRLYQQEQQPRRQRQHCHCLLQRKPVLVVWLKHPLMLLAPVDLVNLLLSSLPSQVLFWFMIQPQKKKIQKKKVERKNYLWKKNVPNCLGIKERWFSRRLNALLVMHYYDVA